ncbi:saccharopine dehydrogenase family protein [Paenibacillus sp. y28]|uniref:saccharopine dehydrogenase family protein n=1 Tax=Paenibacillus sp. y28 TaxID=3129110 RepID=UPI003019CD1A
MKDHILVVGGYGRVGQTICRFLGDRYPGKVYAAGRSLERAVRFCGETEGRVLPLQVDITEPSGLQVLDSAKLVVMCLDQHDTAFVQACLERGTHYVDISAKGDFLARVEGLQSAARANGATAVLSVGLAPGMTNLMAAQASKLLDETEAIDIFIMLGLGDQHGKAAMEWTIDHLNSSFDVTEGGRTKRVQSFTDRKTADFGGALGQSTAYRFPFSDQQTLARTLSVPSVSTRLCFDSSLTTALVSGLQSIGVFRLLRFRAVRRLMVQSFGAVRFGEELFAVKVEARGRSGQKPALAECFFHGNNEAELTARAAGSVADSVYRRSFPAGVHHIEQLFDLHSLRPAVQEGTTLEICLNGQVLGKEI